MLCTGTIWPSKETRPCIGCGLCNTPLVGQDHKYGNRQQAKSREPELMKIDLIGANLDRARSDPQTILPAGVYI